MAHTVGNVTTPWALDEAEEDDAMELICDDDDDEMPNYQSDTSGNPAAAGDGITTTRSLGLPAAPSRAAPRIFCSPTITPPAIPALDSSGGGPATAVGTVGLAEYVWLRPHTAEDGVATGQSPSPSALQTSGDSGGGSAGGAASAALPVATPVDKIGQYFGYNGTDAFVPRAAYAAMLQRVRTLEANLGSANGELRANATAMSDMEVKIQRLERLAKERDAQVRRLDQLEAQLVAREHDLDSRERALEQWSQQLLRRANSKRHQQPPQHLFSSGSVGEHSSANGSEMVGSSGIGDTYRPAPLSSFVGGPWALAGMYGAGGGGSSTSADLPASFASGGAPRRLVGADRREEEAYALWVRGGASGGHHFHPERGVIGGHNNGSGPSISGARYQNNHNISGGGSGVMLPRLLPLRSGANAGVPVRSQTSMDML